MKAITLTSLCVAAAAIAGCAATTPNWDERFGEAVAAATAQQTKNPDAHHPAPDGVDGPAAKAAIDAYQRSFSAPAATGDVLSIGVSAGAGAAQP